MSRSKRKRSEYAKEWAKRNPTYKHDWYLDNINKYRASGYKCKYGISLDQVLAMEEAQNGLCLICSKPDKLQVDHCHETNNVRGLLCRNCNLALGHLKENVKIAESMLEYIKDRCV